MEDILFWFIVGVVAGWLAKLFVPGEATGGMVSHLVVGIVGAVAGGLLFNALGGYNYGGLIGSTVVAFIGAVFCLYVLRAFGRRRMTMH